MVRIKLEKKISKEERDQAKALKKLNKAGIQDDFQLRGFELVSWVHDHQKSISGLIGAVVIAAGLWSGTMFFKQNTNEGASAVYQKVLDSLVGDKDGAVKNREALDGLLKLEKDFSGSKVAGLARLYAGYLSLELGLAPEAVSEYKKYVDENKGNKGLLNPLGTIGLAYAYDKNNEKQKAFDLFEDILNKYWGLSREVILWEAARLARELKLSDIAAKRVEELKSEFPNSLLANSLS